MNLLKLAVLASAFSFSLFSKVNAGGIDQAAEFYEKVERIESLAASFKQNMFDHEGFALQSSSGKLLLQRPNRVYWETLPPYEQIIVGNSEALWVYDPDLDQATYKPGSGDLAGPLALLSQSLEELKNTYDISSTDANNDVSQRFQLNPRDENAQSSFAMLEIYFEQNTLTQIDIVDRMKQKTEITFSDVEINQPIPAKTFEFEVPEGVEVVTNE